MTITVEEEECPFENVAKKEKEEEIKKKKENKMKKEEKQKNKERKEEESAEKKIIRIFSLNVWGIPFGISKNRSERIQALIQILIREPYDYVFLQEVWDRKDYEKLKEWLPTSVPYSHYFESGLLGSGLCIFSRTPIEEAEFYPYSLNGYPHKIFHGDWYAGKGLGLCKTKFEGVPILLINSHLHAAYDGEDYQTHRLCQAFEASQRLKETTININHHLAIFGTDFNSEPSDIPYKMFIYSSGFKDSFTTSETKPPIGTEITSGNACNSYSTPGNEKRIDYVLYRHTEDYQVEVLVHDHPLPNRVPFKEFSFSDHEALRTVISVEIKPAINFDNSSVNDNMRNSKTFSGEEKTFLEAYKICDEGLRNALEYQALWLCRALLVFLMIILTSMFFLIDESTSKNLLLQIIFFPMYFCCGKNTTENMFTYGNQLLQTAFTFLLILYAMIFSFSLYMGVVVSRRECTSLSNTKNLIFQTIFKVACENSNQDC